MIESMSPHHLMNHKKIVKFVCGAVGAGVVAYGAISFLKDDHNRENLGKELNKAYSNITNLFKDPISTEQRAADWSEKVQRMQDGSNTSLDHRKR